MNKATYRQAIKGLATSDEFLILTMLKRFIRGILLGKEYNQVLLPELVSSINSYTTSTPKADAMVRLFKPFLDGSYSPELPWEVLGFTYDSSFLNHNTENPVLRDILLVIEKEEDVKETLEGIMVKGNLLESFDYSTLVDNNVLGLDKKIQALDKLKGQL